MSENNDEKRELEIGDVMPDGTIYAGMSPDTGEALYATPQDAPLRMTWKEATRYAADLDTHGHKDWRLPTRTELRMLYKNRHKGALQGTFNEDDGSDRAHWYWSCTENRDDSSRVYVVDFTGGNDGWAYKDHSGLSTRPVRAEPRPGV